MYCTCCPSVCPFIRSLREAASSSFRCSNFHECSRGRRVSVRRRRTHSTDAAWRPLKKTSFWLKLLAQASSTSWGRLFPWSAPRPLHGPRPGPGAGNPLQGPPRPPPVHGAGPPDSPAGAGLQQGPLRRRRGRRQTPPPPAPTAGRRLLALLAADGPAWPCLMVPLPCLGRGLS